MSATKVCVSHPDLTVSHLLDVYVVWTDAILTCTVCGQSLLAAMIDRNQTVRAYRVTALEQSAAAQTLRAIKQGSCDLTRAASEISHLANHGRLLAQVLFVDGQNVQQWVPVPVGVKLPTGNWRDLKCDGELLKALQAGAGQARS